MTFLPIVERELRVRARQRATFWIRFGTALAGLLICALQFQTFAAYGQDSELGRFVFSSLVVTAFLGCSLAFLLTSDVISSERRENTLGLLLLTRVKPIDVLVGKTVSGGLTAALALAGFFPLLMLPVLAGGVTGGESLRKGLVLVVQLVAAIVAGIWASSRGPDWLKSTTLACLTVMACLPVSGLALVAAGDQVYGDEGFWFFWVAIALLCGIAWLQFHFALSWMKEATRDDETKSSLVPSTEKPEWARTARRRPRLADDINPIEWCVRHTRGVMWALWVAGGLSFVNKCVGLGYESLIEDGGGGVVGWLLWMLWLLSCALGFASATFQAWAATRFIMAARRSGELEVLLSTPLGAGDFITGHWRALRRGIRWPVLVSLIPIIFHAAFCLADGILDRRAGMNWSALGKDLWLISMTWIGVVAICWVGMWFGMRAHKPVSAVAMTVGLTNGLPFAVIIVGELALSSLGSIAPVEVLLRAFRLVLYPLFLLFVIGLVFWARSRLQTDLKGVTRVCFGARSDWEELREAWQRRRTTESTSAS